MAKSQWFEPSEREQRPMVKPNEATQRALDELELIQTWEEFVEICRKQAKRRGY